METKSIGFIGGGRITLIFLTAYFNASEPFPQIHVYDPQEAVLQALQSKFPGIAVSSSDLAPAAGAGIVILAVHPPVMMETLERMKGFLNREAILISLAPKLTIRKISDALDGFFAIARINPSASSVINEGLNPVCYSPEMDKEKKAAIISLMRPLGALPKVDEPKMEAYAMISAMKHTYFWPQLQRLKELAMEFGMEEKEAESVISDMLWGTSETLFNSGLSYAEVMDLIPVKPMGEVEEVIKGHYTQCLTTLFQKIKP
jgi:pyrroline-5-carboxylate reductase